MVPQFQMLDLVNETTILIQKHDYCTEVVLRNQKGIGMLFIGCFSFSVVAPSSNKKVV